MKDTELISDQLLLDVSPGQRQNLTVTCHESGNLSGGTKTDKQQTGLFRDYYWSQLVHQKEIKE